MLTKYDQLKYVVCFALVSLGSLLSQNSKSFFDCPCPQIIAHQGSSLELPPNTIEAFELAINQGADVIELDIWQTKDEIWTVIHDENLSKITGIMYSIIKSWFRNKSGYVSVIYWLSEVSKSAQLGRFLNLP